MTSGNGDVGSFKTGSIASWTVDVPADGIYRFQVISGNTGFPGIMTCLLMDSLLGLYTLALNWR